MPTAISGDTGVDQLQAIALSAFFGGSNQSLATNGYQKFPNGLIIQWGIASTPNDAYTRVNFPISFGTQCYTALASPIYVGAIGGGSVLGSHVGSVDNSGFSIGVSENIATITQSYWIAIGR
jgi:hypothetical protein